jgi:putative hemolysin
MFGQIILQIILIVVSAVFSCAETSFISVNDSTLDKLAENGDKRAVRLKKLTYKPTGFMSSLSALITLFGCLGSAFAAVNFSERLAELIGRTDIILPHDVLRNISVVLITLILSFFTIVLGKLVPERLTARNPEKTAIALSGIIYFFSEISVPFLWLMDKSADIILKIFGINPEDSDDTVTEEEIIMMSDAGAEKGTIDENENRIIKNVFAFDDMTAGQICTHRTDVALLWEADSSETWEETIHRTRHSVFPICGESVDNVIGLLNAKDFFRLDDKSKENIMKNAVREPHFVHENMKADRLFAEMKMNGADRVAVVVDEYGGMSGIITVTDLVEQLVGAFDDDDTDEPSAKFEQIDSERWIIPGITLLSETADELDINLPVDKYETFGGYVIALLGEIPKDGTQAHIDTDTLHIDVLEIKHHRIEVCRVTKVKNETADLPQEIQD